MRATWVFLICGLEAASAIASPRTVVAQPAATKPDPAKAKIAKQYVDAGLAAQNVKDYGTAVSLYQKAYELVPHPALLYNIGQAHRLAGHDADAKSYYERYLEADPRGPHAANSRALILELESKLEAARVAEAERNSSDATRAEQARKEAAEAERVKQDAAAQSRHAQEQQRGEDNARALRAAENERAARGRPLRITGIVGAGTGVAALGVSIAFGLRARSLSKEVSEEYERGKADDGKSAERIAIVTGLVGGGLIVGGAVAYYLGYRQRGDESSVQVSVTPQQVGLMFTGVLP